MADGSLDLSLLLERIETQYNAMCLFCVSEDSIVQLKFPVSDIESLGRQSLCWSESLRPVISAIVRPEDQAAVYAFLQPERVRRALTSPNAQEDILFLSQHNHWKKIILLPLTMKDGHADQVLFLLSDQTLHLARLQALREMSERDALTNLYNRNKLLQMMDTEYRGLRSCGVLFFDVNNLKLVNDALGHAAGDALICQVAESIRSITCHSVLAYRYGGDEFIAVAANCAPTDLASFILLWQERLSSLGQQSGIDASVAVGQAWSDASIDVIALIHEADQNMYENKRIMKSDE